MHVREAIQTGVVFAGLLMTGPGGELPAAPIALEIQSSDLLRPAKENWTSYNGDYTGRRYSALSEITVDNVSGLRAQWVFHTSSSNRLEVTPLVINGVMFVTAANDTYAVDARTGRLIWKHARSV